MGCDGRWTPLRPASVEETHYRVWGRCEFVALPKSNFVPIVE